MNSSRAVTVATAIFFAAYIALCCAVIGVIARPTTAWSAANEDIRWFAVSEKKWCLPDARALGLCVGDFRFFVDRNGDFFVAPLPGGTFTQSGSLRASELAELDRRARAAIPFAAPLPESACRSAGGMSASGMQPGFPTVREVQVELLAERDGDSAVDRVLIPLFKLQQSGGGSGGCVLGDPARTRELVQFVDDLFNHYVGHYVGR